MTKETIIKSALKYLVKMQIAEGSVGFAVDNDHDHDCCWDDVLAWLEAQPCEDAVSRTLVHEAITASIAESENPYEMWQRIEALPSVTPKYTDEEIDKAQAVKQAYVDKMVELKVEETERPKGHCKDCKYFEYDSVAKVEGIPLIVAHEICKRWGDGCKTQEDGYCFLFEPQAESEDK